MNTNRKLPQDEDARPTIREPMDVLITGVSPFEDLPGYQYASLLRDDPRYRLILADDSAPALAVLRDSDTAVVREAVHK